MAGRLRKEIFCKRREAYEEFLETQKSNQFIPEEATDDWQRKSLPYPKKVLMRGVRTNSPKGVCQNSPSSKIVGGHIIRPGEVEDANNEWMMCREHTLWVRVFNTHDKLLFNHVDIEYMYTSQMIDLCVGLVTHLNSLSQNEIEVQEALGTLEGTITTQLTPPLDGQAHYHSWKSQGSSNSDVGYDVGAIAIIRQIDEIFKGQLIDDFVGITFQLK